MAPFMLFVGRMLIGTLFLVSGIGSLLNWEGVLQYFHTMIRVWEIANHQHPTTAAFFFGVQELAMPLVVAAVLLQLAGGVLMMLREHTKLGAAILVTFLIPATLFFQPFWFFVGQDQQLQQMMFLKNLAILGGLLYVLGQGAAATKPAKSSPAH